MSSEKHPTRMPLVREPLVHFLLLAILAFALRNALTAPEASIVVDEPLVAGLRRIGGTGSGAEQSDDVLVETWIRDELLFQEALAMGLERGDEIVRRRLILKMETILSAVDEVPVEEELESYLQSHAEDFAMPGVLTLEHVFFSSDRREDARRDAEEALREAQPVGDAFMLGQREIRRSATTLNQRFGENFGGDVDALDGEGWQGPVKSRFGWHLVRIQERVDAVSPSLEAVRGPVEAAWRDAARQDRLRDAVEALRARTRIEIRVGLGAEDEAESNP